MEEDLTGFIGRTCTVSCCKNVGRARARAHEIQKWYVLRSFSCTAKSGENDEFNADLTHLNEKRLASGKDFDENTGKLKKPDSVVLLDEAKSKDLVEQLKDADWSVTNVDVKTQKRNPAPPFITSTLQQEANRKFNFLGA